MSLNGGTEWHEMYSIPHTTTTPSALLPGCDVRRNTEQAFSSPESGDTMNLGYSDSGAYCLVCHPTHTRAADGTCTASAGSNADAAKVRAAARSGPRAQKAAQPTALVP